MGPLVSFQEPDTSVVPLAAVAVPVRKLELPGACMVCALPALTTGAVLADLTITVTEEEVDCPRLLVAVKVKT